MRNRRGALALELATWRRACEFEYCCSQGWPLHRPVDDDNWMGPLRWHQNMVTVAISFSHHFFSSSLTLAGTSSDTARCERRDAGGSHNVTWVSLVMHWLAVHTDNHYQFGQNTPAIEEFCQLGSTEGCGIRSKVTSISHFCDCNFCQSGAARWLYWLLRRRWQDKQTCRNGTLSVHGIPASPSPFARSPPSPQPSSSLLSPHRQIFRSSSTAKTTTQMMAPWRCPPPLLIKSCPMLSRSR